MTSPTNQRHQDFPKNLTKGEVRGATLTNKVDSVLKEKRKKKERERRKTH